MSLSWLLGVASLLAPAHAQWYCDVQFRGPGLAGSLLERIDAFFGQAPRSRRLEPPNGLILWLESEQQLRNFQLELAPLSITKLEAERRRADVGSLIGRLAMQHQQLSGLSTEPADNYEHQGAATVVRLRVEGRRLNATALLALAQPACRTQASVLDASSDDTVVLGGIHCDDAQAVARQLADGEAAVAWVDLQPAYYALNRWGGATVRLGGNLSAPAAAVLGLDGAGQILSLSDTGVEIGSCFFKDAARTLPSTRAQLVPADTGHRKVRAYWSGSGGDLRDAQPGGGHGTHVAGTAVGAALPGSASLAPFNGVAPASRLAVIDLLPASGSGFLSVPAILSSTLMQWSVDTGAHVHTASWGGAAGSRYTSDEADLDLFAFQNRQFLMVFAAGNDGPSAPSIVSPSYAKNVLSIGATMNGVEAVARAQRPTRPASDYTPDWLSSFSARGTAKLGLRKPDLVAPGGPFVWSAASTGTSCTSLGNALAGFSGTSMATPAVAGAALLLRQYFVEKRYPNSAAVTGVDTSAPTASLLRALLVASAQPLLGVFPRQPFTNAQARIDASGHGRVALGAVLDSPAVQLAVLANEDKSVTRDQPAQSWCVTVKGGSAGARVRTVVALSYTDFPGETIVNDIRLRLVDDATGEEAVVNDQAAPEQRSTNERAQTSARRFSVSVSLERLGVGDHVDFSLVLALERADKTATLVVEPGSVCSPLEDGEADDMCPVAPPLACSGHGAFVDGVCTCLDGWSGPACAECSLASDSQRLARHCLGIPVALSAGSLANRVPIVVERTSVVRRLSGGFYNRTVEKLADARPGAGALDCWCLTASERLDPARFNNHAEFLAAAIEQRAALDALAAHSQAVLASQAISEPSSGAPAARSSASLAREFSVQIFAATLLLAF